MGQQPQTRREIREAERAGRGHVPVVIGLVAVAVLSAAVWFGKGLFTGPSPSGSPSAIPGAAAPLKTTPSAQSMTTSGAPEATAADPLAAAVTSCRTKWGLQSAARADAYLSLGQWGRHIAVMNDLRAGKLSVARAKTLWAETTVKAEENVAAFRAADKALTASKDGCNVDASATGPLADAVRSCATSMETVDTVLARARTAIAPWEKHLKDQSHYKAGGMTPAAAEAAWRALWRQGLATLPAYTAVAAQGQNAACKLPA
jgi:hypothetical protein